MSLPLVKLNDGRQIPALGYGLGTANFGKDCSGAVCLALAEGYCHLDGAEMYANDEFVCIGLEGSEIPRQEIFYTTKCSSPDPKRALKKALQSLKLTYVDLYLLHGPEYFDDIGLARAWEMCEELQREGLCKSIGVSNFRVKDLEELKKTAKVTPAVNQIELHPYLLKASQPLLNYCKDNNIVIEAFGPLTPLTRAKDGPLDEVLERLAASKNATPGQILLKWSQHIGAQVVLTTSSNSSRLKEQMAAFTRMPDLLAEDVHAISVAGSGHHYRAFAPHMNVPQ